MEIKVDERVTLVMEFMSRNFQGVDLVEIAKGVADLAPVMWGAIRKHKEPFLPLQFVGSETPVFGSKRLHSVAAMDQEDHTGSPSQ